MTISIKNAKKKKKKKNTLPHSCFLIRILFFFFSLNTTLVAALPFIILFKVNHVIRLNGLIII